MWQKKALCIYVNALYVPSQTLFTRIPIIHKFTIRIKNKVENLSEKLQL